MGNINFSRTCHTTNVALQVVIVSEGNKIICMFEKVDPISTFCKYMKIFCVQRR